MWDGGGGAQTVLDWPQLEARFRANNPSLRAGQINIDESKAEEITAYLRPNPNFTFGVDQLQPFTGSPYRPLTAAFTSASFDYLHERQHKRELRLESARNATSIAVSQQDDMVRNLIYSLRNSFIQTLQAKAVQALAKENLDYFDREAAISRDRLRSGDIAQLDLNRIELQRVQYESDFQTASVSMRTAKIELLQALNDRTPVDRFDVSGKFDFSDNLTPLEEFHAQAAASRPDLKAALETVEKAKTNHKFAVSNGSTDPRSRWISLTTRPSISTSA